MALRPGLQVTDLLAYFPNIALVIAQWERDQPFPEAIDYHPWFTPLFVCLAQEITCQGIAFQCHHHGLDCDLPARGPAVLGLFVEVVIPKANSDLLLPSPFIFKMI